MTRRDALAVVAALINVAGVPMVCVASNTTNGTLLSTTTEMPWGLPWWGWFIMTFLLSIFVAIPCLALLVGLGGIFGEYESGQRKAKQVETVYQIVDEPDIEESGLLLPSCRDR
mmetsp:Transcript_30376/g.69925  ORF Transcript_30376/g.69925 Transcript_30376/m.69925 type:complete len:114 (+) Transcript_30376:64-405(+)